MSYCLTRRAAVSTPGGLQTPLQSEQALTVGIVAFGLASLGEREVAIVSVGMGQFDDL